MLHYGCSKEDRLFATTRGWRMLCNVKHMFHYGCSMVGIWLTVIQECRMLSKVPHLEEQDVIMYVIWYEFHCTVVMLSLTSFTDVQATSNRQFSLSFFLASQLDVANIGAVDIIFSHYNYQVLQRKIWFYVSYLSQSKYLFKNIVLTVKLEWLWT